MSVARCDSPAIFARWGREELADVHRCEAERGHKGSHRAHNPRTGELTLWDAAYPTPTPGRVRAATKAAAALTPEIEAAVLAEEEQRHAAWCAANPEKVAEAHAMAERMRGTPSTITSDDRPAGHRTP